MEVQLSNGGVRGAADTVRAYYDAVNRRDVTTALAVVADDVLYEDLALYPKVRPCALGASRRWLRGVGKASITQPQPRHPSCLVVVSRCHPQCKLAAGVERRSQQAGAWSVCASMVHTHAIRNTSAERGA